MALKIEKFRSPGKGYGLRTKVPVSPGDVLCVEEPFAYTVNHAGWGNVCEFCLCMRDKLLQCSHCKFAKYCGRQCQKEAWPDHKRECKCLKGSTCDVTTHTVRLVGRVIFKLLQNKSGGSNNLYTMSDLMSNFSGLGEAMKAECEYFAEILRLYLRPEIPDLSQLPIDLSFPEYFAKVFCNRFMIINDTMENVANGLYLDMSLLNHSCDPNCTVIFKGSHFYLCANKNMEAGEELTKTYIDPLNATEERQSQLRRKYCFECECHYCRTRCQDERMLAGDQQASDETKALVSRVQPMQTQRKWTEVLELCKTQLEKNSGRLPDHNIYQLKLLSSAMDACMPLNLHQEFLEYGIRTLGPYELYYPGCNLMRAFQLRKVGLLQNAMSKSGEGLENLSEALRILRLFYGDDHRQTQELIQVLTILRLVGLCKKNPFSG